MIKNTEIKKLVELVKDESVTIAGKYGTTWKVPLYNTGLKIFKLKKNFSHKILSVLALD